MTEFIRLIYWGNLPCTPNDIQEHYFHLLRHEFITKIKDMHLTHGIVICDYFIRSKKPKIKQQLQTYLQTLRNTKQIRHFLFLGTYTGGGPQPRLLQPPKKDRFTILDYVLHIDVQIQKIHQAHIRPEVPSHV